jgi:hypothetical protein
MRFEVMINNKEAFVLEIKQTLIVPLFDQRHYSYRKTPDNLRLILGPFLFPLI